MVFNGLDSLINNTNGVGHLTLSKTTLPVRVTDATINHDTDGCNTTLTVEVVGKIGENPFGPIKSDDEFCIDEWHKHACLKKYETSLLSAATFDKVLFKRAVNSLYGQKIGELAKYCKADVESTELLYKTMNLPRPSIKKVIFNEPATIVLWSDGTKTVVRAQNGEEYDPEKGLAMAISKRMLGNDYSYYNVFKKWLKKYEQRKEEENAFTRLAKAFSDFRKELL